MTRLEHIAQRDMVVRSLLVSSIRTERSEERARKPRIPVVPPVLADVPHRFVFPVVTERPL